MNYRKIRCPKICNISKVVQQVSSTHNCNITSINLRGRVAPALACCLPIFSKRSFQPAASCQTPSALGRLMPLGYPEFPRCRIQQVDCPASLSPSQRERVSSPDRSAPVPIWLKSCRPAPQQWSKSMEMPLFGATLLSFRANTLLERGEGLSVVAHRPSVDEVDSGWHLHHHRLPPR